MLGVIGGAGVAATNLFNTRLEQRITRKGGFRDFHHPRIVTLQSTDVPSRSLFHEGRGPSYVPYYIRDIRKLESIGATEVLMVCNTAHLSYELIAKNVNVKLLNIIEIVNHYCSSNNYRKIGLLASDSTISFQLYRRFLSSGLDFIYPNPDLQKMVTQSIINSKNNKRWLPIEDPQNPKNLLLKAGKRFENDSCDCVLIGCTDLCYLDLEFGNLPVVNCIDVVVEQISSVVNKFE